jgi:transposase
MRGVGFIVAVTVVAEIGDFQRFDHPRQLMAYLGLTPSEHSSGASVRRGGITKASGLARRALIEGAWSYRMQARLSPKLLARLEALPQAVRDIA